MTMSEEQLAKKLIIKPLDDRRVIERLRVIDKYHFPVKYTDKYYEALQLHVYNQLAFFNEALVGSCTCRFERINEGEEPATFRLYVMTIGVLAPYRRLHIGTKLMKAVIDAVGAEQNVKIDHIALHVQVGSKAHDFYQSFGFDVKEEVKDYYTELDVNDALLLTKAIPQPYLKKSATKVSKKEKAEKKDEKKEKDEKKK